MVSLLVQSLALTSFALRGLVFAQAIASPSPGPPLPPRLHAVRAAAPPRIDGKLDDPAWAEAAVTDAFTQQIPAEGKPATERTVLRVLYDDDALYFAFDCEQRAPIELHMTRRDRYSFTDLVWVTIDSRGDGKSAFEFDVTASGNQIDGVYYDDTTTSSDWDENWESHTALTAKGWSAELRIPLRILRFDSAAAQTWGFQASRYVSALQELDQWSLIPRSAGGEVSHYGKLDDLEGLRARTPFEVRPFVVGKLRHRGADPDIVSRGFDVGASAGLDLKWHPTQSLTVDGTINPDFAQVEADQIVLNLTNTETFYPEKRPFFLEGVDLFATPLKVFYSRRIGRTQLSPTLRADPPYSERLVDAPEPSTIYGAGKVVGKLGDRWSVGAVTAWTAANRVDVQLADGSRRRELLEPLTAFGAVRLKYDVARNAAVGLIATSATRFDPASGYPAAPSPPPASGAPPPGPRTPSAQLCPGGFDVPFGSRCFHDAYVAGLDGRWRSSGGDYVVSGQAIGSAIAFGPPRTQRDGTVIQGGDVAPGAQVRLAKEGGEHWVTDLTYEGAGRKLDYNALGFMSRQNVLSGQLNVEYRTLDPWWALRDTHTRVELTERDNLDGLNLARAVALNTSWRFQKFLTLSSELHFRAEHFDDREVGDGTALQRQALLGYVFGVATDPRATLSAQLTSTNERIVNGYNVSLDGTVTLRVLPQFDVAVLPQLVFTDGEPRYAAAGAAPGEDVFGTLRAKSVGSTLRATYAFTPHLTMEAYGQLFLASGHYSSFTSFTPPAGAERPVVRLSALVPASAPATNPDFEKAALNVNLVLRWEYRVGSTLFLVYTRSQSPSGTLPLAQPADLHLRALGQAPATDLVLMKVSYWWG